MTRVCHDSTIHLTAHSTKFHAREVAERETFPLDTKLNVAIVMMASTLDEHLHEHVGDMNHGKQVAVDVVLMGNMLLMQTETKLN